MSSASSSATASVSSVVGIVFVDRFGFVVVGIVFGDRFGFVVVGIVFGDRFGFVVVGIVFGDRFGFDYGFFDGVIGGDRFDYGFFVGGCSVSVLGDFGLAFLFRHRP